MNIFPIYDGRKQAGITMSNLIIYFLEALVKYNLHTIKLRYYFIKIIHVYE